MGEHRNEEFKFMQETLLPEAKICLAIRMPDGSTELIINENALAKVAYVLQAYDEELRLKANPAIEILSWMIYT